MLKKILFITFIIFSLIFTSCQISWFEDIKSDMEQNLSSVFRFFSQKEDENPEAVVETVSVHIGDDYSLADVSLEKFDGLWAGYHIGGWKYYRAPMYDAAVDAETTAVINNSIVTRHDGTVEKLKVTPHHLDFLASWNPNTDTKYKVEHYFQTIDLQDYNLYEEATQILEGTTDTSTQAKAIEQKGFTTKEILQTNINGDGSGLVKIYYDRKKINITIFYNDGRIDDGVEFEGYFEQTVQNIELPDRTADALVFDGWKVTFEDGTEKDLKEPELKYSDDKAVYNAKWKVIPAEANVTVIYPPAEMQRIFLQPEHLCSLPLPG